MFRRGLMLTLMFRRVSSMFRRASFLYVSSNIVEYRRISSEEGASFFFGQKSLQGRRKLKPIVRAMNFRGASAGDVRKFTAPPKQAVCRFSGLGDQQHLFDEHFCRTIFFRRRKMKCRGSSETRFPKVSGQTEPSSGGKRIFKVCEKFEKKIVSGVEK